jgi:hypothetical protein
MPVAAAEIISDDDTLLRRVHPSQVVNDKNLGRDRPSSGVFTDPEMSTDSDALLTKHGLDSSFCLKGYSGYSLTRIDVKFARTNGMTVTNTPKEDNAAHTDVIGKKTEALQRQFAKHATWVHLEGN